MWLKVVIVVLFVALVISLFSGLGFLKKNQDTESKTAIALRIRLVLTMLLIGFLFYGVFTGRLGSNAPWDARYLKDQNNETPADGTKNKTQP